jgi:hypothetical protein
MSSRFLWRCGLGVVVAALLFGGRAVQQASGQATNTPPPALELNTNAKALEPPTANGEASMAEQADAAALAEAAVKPISTEKPLPPNIRLTKPASEVVKLAEAGVDESVMMAFVTNSTSLFQLGVEEILYLNDIGVPGSVVTAMIQRDEALKGLMGGAEPLPVAPEPEAPAQYAPQPDAVPPGAEMAPEGPPPADNAMVDYSQPPGADIGYDTFYNSLAPYGTWVDVAGYGPCWQPTVVVANPTWRPYCDSGRWVYSDCGWYWLSGYSWGWAPFHYGRWFRHNRLGWCWAPDSVWGPSWVCWRYGGSHCGWAPLPPGAWYRPRVGLTFHGRRVSGTFGFGLGVNSFAFVEVSHFRNAHLNRHELPPQQAARVYNTTRGSTMIVEDNHRVINHGIPASRVAEATGTAVRRVAIRDARTTAGQGTRGERSERDSRTLSVFRPRLAPASRPLPGSGGRSSSEFRNGDSGSARARGVQSEAPDPMPQAAGTTDTSRSRPTARPQEAFPRPAANQKPQWGTEPVWSGRRTTPSPVRSEPQRQYTAPSYQAPAVVPRAAPAPAATPPPRPSFSPPSVTSTPRMQQIESRPAPSAPPAPASRAPSSPDRRGR